MAYTFLRARGVDTGDSLVEEDKIALAADLLDRMGSQIKLPVDHVLADAFSASASTRIASDTFGEGWMGMDIGPETARGWSETIRGARTVVWNGPMGVFEMEPFAPGTLAMAHRDGICDSKWCTHGCWWW